MSLSKSELREKIYHLGRDYGYFWLLSEQEPKEDRAHREEFTDQIMVLFGQALTEARIDERRLIINFIRSLRRKTKRGKNGWNKAMVDTIHNQALFDITWDFDKNIGEFKLRQQTNKPSESNDETI